MLTYACVNGAGDVRAEAKANALLPAPDMGCMLEMLRRCSAQVRCGGKQGDNARNTGSGAINILNKDVWNIAGTSNGSTRRKLVWSSDVDQAMYI